MVIFNLVRLIIFVTLTLFSFIILGILCNFTSITTSEGFYYHSFALGIATSLLTIIAIITVLVIDKLRKGAVSSLVWFELVWTGLLWIFWLACAASITSLHSFTTCGFDNTVVESTCQQYQAVQAFCWLNWLMVFGWFLALLILAFITYSRGNNGIWVASTTEAPFLSSPPPSKARQSVRTSVAPSNGGTMGAPVHPHATSSPNAQQLFGNPGAPQQYPGSPEQYPAPHPPQEYGGPPQQSYTQRNYPPQGYGQPGVVPV